MERQDPVISITSEEKNVEAADNEENMDLDDEINPALLCPDIIMEVNDNPIMEGNGKALKNVDKDNILAVKLHLSTEEKKTLDQMKLNRNRPVQFTTIHCTACNCHLGSSLARLPNMYVHPLLEVIVCKACYNYYSSGDFEQDEDGTEMYCRWCGQGGEVVCCAKCPMVFCKPCIEINFDEDKMKEIQKNDDWKCFSCDAEQVKQLRLQCSELAEYFQKEMARFSDDGQNNSLMKIDYSKCCGDRRSEKKRKADRDETYTPYKDERQRYSREYNKENAACLRRVEPTVSAAAAAPNENMTQQKEQQQLQQQSDGSGGTLRVNSLGKPLFLSLGMPFHNVNSASGFPQQSTNSAVVGVNPLVLHASTSQYQPQLPSWLPTQQDGPRSVLPTGQTVMRPIRSQHHVRQSSQVTSTPKVLVTKSVQVGDKPYDESKRCLDKAMCSAALANSTVATSLLELSEQIRMCRSSEDQLTLYNTLRDSLGTYIKSLAAIKGDINIYTGNNTPHLNSISKTNVFVPPQPLPPVSVITPIVPSPGPLFYLRPQSFPPAPNFDIFK